MYETNLDSFDYKPMTLYSFFPKNKRFKLLKQDTNIVSNNKNKLNSTNEKFTKEKSYVNKKRNMQWTKTNSKYNYNHNFEPSGKIIKFNGIASSTSNNFYNNNNDHISKKFSFKYKYSFRNSSLKKNTQKEVKYKKQDRIKSTGDSFYQYFQNVDNKDINEKYLEQFLDAYDSKLQKNLKDMKVNNSNGNNYYIFNLKNSKNNNLQSSKNKNNIIKSDYINPIKFKNIIRLNNDKIYNYLPYLDSSTQNKKRAAKTQKKL